MVTEGEGDVSIKIGHDLDFLRKEPCQEEDPVLETDTGGEVSKH